MAYSDKDHTKEAVDMDKYFAGNILIAEDNKTNQQLIEIMLQNKGLHTTIVENGEEVVDSVISNFNNIDLILMDVNMPKKDGITASKEIQEFLKSCELPKIPIVFLSANAMKEDIELYNNVGDGYISKPISNKSLVQTLSNFLKPLSMKPENDNTAQENILSNSILNLDEMQKYKDSISLKVKNEVEESKTLPIELDPNYRFDLKKAANNLMLDEEVFKSIFNSFLSTIDEDIMLLELAIEENDIKDIDKKAHFIKGTVSNLSIDPLYKIAEVINISAREGKQLDYYVYLNQLKDELNKLKKGITW
jgi:CheY-like chemotaxis protein/HPt (histidine-containing phosphotransfer) domain-containing protein